MISDWLPATRTGQLTMAKNWVTLLKTKAAGWNVPANAASDLQKQADEAEKALAAAQNEDTRTPVANAHCKTAFETLAVAMRDLKLIDGNAKLSLERGFEPGFENSSAYENQRIDVLIGGGLSLEYLTGQERAALFSLAVSGSPAFYVIENFSMPPYLKADFLFGGFWQENGRGILCGRYLSICIVRRVFDILFCRF